MTSLLSTDTDWLVNALPSVGEVWDTLSKISFQHIALETTTKNPHAVLIQYHGDDSLTFDGQFHTDVPYKTN